MKQAIRRLPKGIQSFERLRRDGYVYVDKTDLVWQVAHDNVYNYLSRPRRFGKTLFVDALACYLEGKKSLFEGLKIMDMEEDWTQHPVIRLDMSGAGGTEQNLKAYLNACFSEYEEKYGITPSEMTDFSVRFSKIIRTAYKWEQQTVGVLIDEYDHPLQHSWGTPEHEKVTAIYRSVFSVLKMDNYYLQLVFITGVTKFTQISLFSCLNNLTNISFLPQYSTICGFTLDEIKDNFGPEIDKMGEINGWTREQTIAKLVENYDGYHFSDRNMNGLFNPFSLTNALADCRISNYWIGSGATIALSKFAPDMGVNIENLEDCRIDRDILESSDITSGDQALFLYQTGYLTLKGFDDEEYVLCIPNKEVRSALLRVALPMLTMKEETAARTTQSWLRRHLRAGEVEQAMKALGALIADVPYSNKKLATLDIEERYRLLCYTIFKGLNIPAQIERMSAKGRADIVIKANEYIWVIELKLIKNGGLDAATAQIADRQYKAPFEDGHLQTIGLAIELDDEGRGITRWNTI